MSRNRSKKRHRSEKATQDFNQQAAKIPKAQSGYQHAACYWDTIRSYPRPAQCWGVTQSNLPLTATDPVQSISSCLPLTLSSTITAFILCLTATDPVQGTSSCLPLTLSSTITATTRLATLSWVQWARKEGGQQGQSPSTTGGGSTTTELSVSKLTYNLTWFVSSWTGQPRHKKAPDFPSRTGTHTPPASQPHCNQALLPTVLPTVSDSLHFASGPEEDIAPWLIRQANRQANQAGLQMTSLLLPGGLFTRNNACKVRQPYDTSPSL